MSQQRPKHPHIRYFVLCEETKINDDGRFDCINVFEDLAVREFPSNVKMDIVVGLDRMPGDRDYELSFLLEDPSGEARKSPSITVPVKIDDPTPAYILTTNLRFHQAGRYVIRVQFDGSVVESYEFWLVHKAAEARSEFAIASSQKE